MAEVVDRAVRDMRAAGFEVTWTERREEPFGSVIVIEARASDCHLVAGEDWTVDEMP
jgi:hypothetical protein